MDKREEIYAAVEAALQEIATKHGVELSGNVSGYWFYEPGNDDDPLIGYEVC